jgi:hypothetical protein
MQECFVSIIDARTLEKRATFALDIAEMGLGVVACTLHTDSTEYWAVSTGYINEEETESSKGRILLLTQVRIDLIFPFPL